jgi:NAD-dependent SIR2 family protein deacetylase
LLKDKKKDRSIFARLLNTFQEKEELRNYEWRKLNLWLFDQILEASPTPFHKKLADLCEEIDSLCLTLNFDGLLIRELVQYRSRPKSFSLPTKKECESFFLRDKDRLNGRREFLEIQIRGDILYVVCNSRSYCPQQGKEYPLWTSVASFPKPVDANIPNTSCESTSMREVLLKCPSCGDTRFSFLSFPGSFKKEKDMQDMIQIIWKYCAFRIASVTVVGLSGEWDPLIVAFLGDLLSEREIPLLVVDKHPEIVSLQPDKTRVEGYTYVVKELVKPRLHNSACLMVDADSFMESLSRHFQDGLKSSRREVTFKDCVTEDCYWQTWNRRKHS